LRQNKTAINHLDSFLKSAQTYLKTGKITADTASTVIIAAWWRAPAVRH
jgi:hypothetical protein